MFSGLSIGKKIGFGFSALIMITMGLGFYSVIQLGNVNDTATEIKESWMPSIVAVSDLNISTSDFKIAALEHLSSLTEANMKEYEADQSRIHAHMLEVRAKYEKLITSPEEQKNYDEFSAAWAKYLVENEKIIQLSRQNKNEEAKELIRGKSKEYFDLANSRLVSLVDTNVKGGDEASDRGDAMYSSSLKLIVFAIGFCAASGAFIGWLLISSLSKALQKVISDLQSGSAHVTTASTEIAGASTEISASATQQASALQETVASITEITETVRGSTQNALKSKEIAEESEQVALRGKTVVSDMIISVEEIDKSNEDIKIQVNESNKQISEIITVINEIGNKTKVINDIVFQTKLLSFNASIEAARAGEHGKGFAVVAEEVGNLAQMSGTAANDISSMLSSSINKVEAIIHNTKTKVEELVVVSKKKVDAGLNQARRCDEVLENIVQKVSTAKTMAIEIAESSREQALGIGQIEKAMNELELVNNQNTTASQQCSVSAEELANQAENLNSMIHVLVETVEGKSAKKGVTTSAQVIDFDSHVKKDKSFDRVG